MGRRPIQHVVLTEMPAEGGRGALEGFVRLRPSGFAVTAIRLGCVRSRGELLVEPIGIEPTTS